MKSPGEALTTRGRRCVRLAIIAVAAVCAAGMRCQPASPPSRGKTPDMIHDAFLRLVKDPSNWEPEFLALEARLDDEPELRKRLEAYRTEAFVIRTGEPGCTTWVDAYMLVALTEAFATSVGIEYQAPKPLCPTVPPTFDAGERKELVLHGFTMVGTVPTVRAIASLGFSTPLAPDTVTTGRYVFSSKSFLQQACGVGKLIVYLDDEEFLSVPLTADGSPQLSCAAGIDEAFEAEVADCNQECCNFENTAQCVVGRCDAECDSRKRANTKGHPAIGDACSESGAYYQWCRSDCGEVEKCRKTWCGEESTLRKTCLRSAEVKRDFAIAKCPTEYRCKE